MEYSIYYRYELVDGEDWGEWDLFLSAYNSSDRLSKVFDNIKASKKHWLIYPEYNFTKTELNPISLNNLIYIAIGNESTQLNSLIKSIDLKLWRNKSICIDATGFMRPQLLFITCWLKTIGFKKIDFLYSEPRVYDRGEKTKFSSGTFNKPRQIAGYQGVNNLSGEKDLLIIAAGYDSALITKVAQTYENAEIVQLIGFPSLRPDMYQENLLRTEAVSDDYGAKVLRKTIFAPASDPFETAAVIKRYLEKNNCMKKFANIYICPLSTKAQALGISFLYLREEYLQKNVSVIYPFSTGYSKETSQGIAKIWQYTFEF